MFFLFSLSRESGKRRKNTSKARDKNLCSHHSGSASPVNQGLPDASTRARAERAIPVLLLSSGVFVFIQPRRKRERPVAEKIRPPLFFFPCSFSKKRNHHPPPLRGFCGSPRREQPHAFHLSRPLPPSPVGEREKDIPPPSIILYMCSSSPFCPPLSPPPPPSRRKKKNAF